MKAEKKIPSSTSRWLFISRRKAIDNLTTFWKNTTKEKRKSRNSKKIKRTIPTTKSSMASNPKGETHGWSSLAKTPTEVTESLWFKRSKKFMPSSKKTKKAERANQERTLSKSISFLFYIRRENLTFELTFWWLASTAVWKDTGIRMDTFEQPAKNSTWKIWLIDSFIWQTMPFKSTMKTMVNSSQATSFHMLISKGTWTCQITGMKQAKR